MSVEDNKAIVAKSWEGISANNLDAAVEGYDENVIYHGAAGEEIQGREGLLEMIGGYFTAFPDLKAQVESVIGEGDRVFARISLSGANTGELMGMPATGKQLELRWIIHETRFADGKVVEEWEIFDRMDLMAQLGHVPADG